MEKIIDRILSDFRWTPKYFNEFCSENKLDKSSRSAFKSSLESIIKELSSERDQIEKYFPPYTIKRENTRIEYNFTLDKKIPVYENVKKFDSKSDKEKFERDEKRKDKLEKKISDLDNMLQIVNLYSEKENTPTKENENNVPGLMQFGEPVSSFLKELKQFILTCKEGGVNSKTAQSDIKLRIERFYRKYENDKDFRYSFKYYETFLRLIYPSIKPALYFDWKLNPFVKTLKNKFS